ncbi:MAG: hypothetical protein JNN15_15365, partial [Blastocatellia bacterium]|nr:hypothetical protein [Blastocatellia bacterium]
TLFPKAIAVEMEGLGAANAIEVATAKDKTVHFLMIRGISDLPRPEEQVEENRPKQGTDERDAWKKYASETAAAFTASFIKSGLPKPPRNNPEDPG